MTTTKYTQLTGLTVASSREAVVEAQIKRTRAILESLLGYPLEKSKVFTNYYEELGKSASDYSIPDDDDDLLAPDDVIGSYRLFDYHAGDMYLPVDPYTTLNAVKLVYIRQGETPNGITIRTFETDEIQLQVGAGGISKYIARCKSVWPSCECNCDDCVQLAVDAEWVFEECIPNELMYIWADMVTDYSDQKRNIRSQTLGPHSYTKFDKESAELLPHNRDILMKYAGPRGTLYRTITI